MPIVNIIQRFPRPRCDCDGRQEVDAPVCLEEGQRYELKLEFTQYSQTEQGAKILIDSVALLPYIEDIPFLNPDFLLDQQPGQDQGSGDGFLLDNYDDLEQQSGYGGTDYDGSGMGQDDGSGMVQQQEITEEERKVEEVESPMAGWFPGREAAERDRQLWDQLDCR